MDTRIRRWGGPWLLAASLTVAAACASRSGPRGGVDDPCGRVRTPPVEEVAQLQLHDAARTGDAGQIECLTAAGADVNAFDLNRMTPLYVAAIHGQVEAITALVDVGAGVDAGENLWGFAPLHAAVANGQVGAMNALIDAGADVNALANPFGTSPLHLALGGAFFNVLFLDPDDGHERHAPVSVVRALLVAGADPNAVEYDANLTPLQLALIGQDGGGNIEYVRALLSAGADPNKRTLVHGDPGPEDFLPTAMHLAAGSGEVEVIEVLVSAGADVNVRDWREATPLDLAQKNGHDEATAVLRAHGAR